MGEINYDEYINCQEWRRRRRAFLDVVGNVCNRCGMTGSLHRAKFGTGLHVHHKTYARLGNELDEDLEALCKNCHEQEEGLQPAVNRVDVGGNVTGNFQLPENFQMQTIEALQRRLSTFRWLAEFMEASGSTFTEEDVSRLTAAMNDAGKALAEKLANQES